MLELAHSALVSYEVYRVTITLYGRPDLVVRFVGLGVITVIGGFITMLCQVRPSACQPVSLYVNLNPHAIR
jgi:hypothetical protein